MSIDYFKAEFKKLETEEIAITGYRNYYSTRPTNEGATIYPRKKDLLWIINILRGSSFEDVYHFGHLKEKLKTDDTYIIMIEISGGDDRSLQGHVEIAVKNINHPTPRKNEPNIMEYWNAFTIAFDSDNPMNPNDSLAAFIRQLEQYVPAEDKDKILPPWKTITG